MALEAAEDALAVGRLEEPRGPLAVGLPLAGGQERWFGLVQAYSDRYPAVDVRPRQAMTEQLQDQILAGELDGAIGFVPARRAGLTYTHVVDETLSITMHSEHPFADRVQIELADLEGVRLTLVGGSGAERSGYNVAVRGLFADAGVRPDFVLTDEAYPVRAGRSPDYLGISPRNDFPQEVVSVPLVPPCRLPFEFIARAGSSRAAVRAFAPFAAAHLADPCAARIATP